MQSDNIDFRGAHGSGGKESACNARDSGNVDLIPGLGNPIDRGV